MAILHALLVSFAVIGLLPLCIADPRKAANSGASTAIVTGSIQCDGCSDQNFDRRLALSGSSVAIRCKTGKGEATIQGVGSVDENGSFSVRLPSSVLDEKGELTAPCFARLVSGNPKLCSFANNPSSKLVFRSPHTFTTSEVVSFSPLSCKAKPQSDQLPLNKPKLIPKPKISNPQPSSAASEHLPTGTTQSYTSRPKSSTVAAPSTINTGKTFIIAPPLEDVLPTGGPPVKFFMFPFMPIINTKYQP